MIGVGLFIMAVLESLDCILPTGLLPQVRS